MGRGQGEGRSITYASVNTAGERDSRLQYILKIRLTTRVDSSRDIEQ